MDGRRMWFWRVENIDIVTNILVLVVREWKQTFEIKSVEKNEKNYEEDYDLNTIQWMESYRIFQRELELK